MFDVIDDDNWYLSDVLISIEEFINESNLPITYSKYNSIKYLANLLGDMGTKILVVSTALGPAGFAIIGYDNEFHEERFGYVSKFYIRKQHRGTEAGRLLTESMCKWFDENECVTSFATATAGIQEDQLFINLLRKYNFLQGGTVLTRNR